MVFVLILLSVLLKKSSTIFSANSPPPPKKGQFPPPTHPSVGFYKYFLFIYVFYFRLYCSITITLLTYEVMLEMMVNRGYYTVGPRYEFYFRVAKQYFTHSLRPFVKYCFCNENVKFISSSGRVMFFLLYRQKDIDKIIDFYSPKSNCDGSDLQYSNIRHWLQ